MSHMSAITIALGGAVAASTAGAARSTSGRSVAKKSAVQVSTRNATVCRVIQDVTSSMDVGSSIDTDAEMRRRMVQMDTTHICLGCSESFCSMVSRSLCSSLLQKGHPGAPLLLQCANSNLK